MRSFNFFIKLSLLIIICCLVTLPSRAQSANEQKLNNEQKSNVTESSVESSTGSSDRAEKSNREQKSVDEKKSIDEKKAEKKTNDGAKQTGEQLARTLGEFTVQDIEGGNYHLGDAWTTKPVVLVFIRHFG